MERPEIEELSSEFVFIKRDSLEELQEYINFLEEENTVKDNRIKFLKQTITRVIDKYLPTIAVLKMVDPDPEYDYYSPTREELIDDVTEMTAQESCKLWGREWLEGDWYDD